MFKKLKFAKGTVKPSLGLHEHFIECISRQP